MSDNLTVFGTDFTGVTGIKATGTGNGTLTYIRPQGTKSISANGSGIDVTAYASVDVSVPTGVDTSDDTVDAAHLFSGYTAHDSSGSAITGSYVAPTARTSSDVTVSGATVTVPAGAYASQVQKSVASGTAGTPTASKGSVSNHSVSVTPSVTNTAGYISGGTKTGTSVTVSASELVSGSETKTANGTYDVTNLASLVVAISYSTIYTSSSNPSSSQGSNGDIWLVV